MAGALRGRVRHLAALLLAASGGLYGCGPGRQRIEPAVGRPAAVSEEEGPSALRAYALRLRPGADVKLELEAFVRRHALRAGAILTAVGSVTQARLRFSGREEYAEVRGKFEIVSLTGTLAPDGIHAHLALAGDGGGTIGGHMGEGCLVFTTAEIVIVEMPDLVFGRALNAETQFKELRILPRRAAKPGPPVR